MDSQLRLTRRDEWQMNVLYYWLKGGRLGVQLHRFKGFDAGMVLLECVGGPDDGQLVHCTGWRNRFIPSHAAGHLLKKHP